MLSILEEVWGGEANRLGEVGGLIERKPCAPFARTISRVSSTLEGESDRGGGETRVEKVGSKTVVVGLRARNPCAPFARTISLVLSILEEVLGGEANRLGEVGGLIERKPCAPFARTISRVFSTLEGEGDSGGEIRSGEVGEATLVGEVGPIQIFVGEVGEEDRRGGADTRFRGDTGGVMGGLSKWGRRKSSLGVRRDLLTVC